MEIIARRIPSRAETGITLFSDLHLGATLCDEGAIRRDLAAAADRGDLIALNGDIFDAIAPHDPRYVADTLAPQYRVADPMNEVLDAAESILRPYRKSIVWLGLGNHETKHAKYAGVSLLKCLANRVGCVINGYSGVIELWAGLRRVALYTHHGPRAKGRRSCNWVEGVQVAWTGHFHEKGATGRRRWVGDRWVSRWEVHTGAYLASYGGIADYAEQAGYEPGLSGCVRVVIQGGEIVRVEL